jgi:hypothetical protein
MACTISHDLDLPGAFEQIAAGAGPHGREHRVVIAEHGQDQHGGVGAGGDDPAGRVDTVQLGHVQVHDDHIREVGRGQRDRLLAASGLPDHLQAVTGGQQPPEPVTKQRVIVGNQNTDRVHLSPHSLAAWR